MSWVRSVFRRRLPLLVLVLTIATPATVLATDIYVNGVRITYLTGVTLQNATVRFDDRGNLHISAPGYRVIEERHDGTERELTADGGVARPRDAGTATTEPPSPDTRPVPPAITRRYFVVAETNAPGQVQYEIEVRINGGPYRTFRDTPARVIDDITSRLRPGPNELHLIARRVGRRSTSATDYLRLTIGEGRAQGTTAVVDTTLVRFQRGADENRTVEQTFTVFAR